MKNSFIKWVLLLLPMTLSAQEIVPQKTIADDYIPLLNSMGYNFYKFDISTFADNTYYISFVIKEYINNVETERENSDFVISMTNRIMLSDFEPEEQEIAIRQNMVEDVEKGIFRLAKNLTVGFLPIENDTVRKVVMSLPGLLEGSYPLSLLPIAKPDGTSETKYSVRPFNIEGFDFNKFTPLVSCISYWWDENAGVVRCCGDSEIEPDMSSDILKDSPHYYIVGVLINK